MLVGASLFVSFFFALRFRHLRRAHTCPHVKLLTPPIAQIVLWHYKYRAVLQRFKYLTTVISYLHKMVVDCKCQVKRADI